MSRARTHRIGLFAPAAGAVAAAPFHEDEFVVAAPAETVFTPLSFTFAVGGLSIVTFNGLRLRDGTDYTISGTTLTLTIATVTEVGDCIVVAFEHV